MSHEITEIDAQEGTEMAWHGKTLVRPRITTEDCLLTKYNQIPVPLYDQDGRDCGFSILQCSDNQVFVGKPYNPLTYTAIDNKTFLALIKNSLAGTGHTIASIGSVAGRTKVFCSVKLNDMPKFKAAGRDFEPYLNFLNSFGGVSPFIVSTGNTCVVCANTYAMAVQEKGKAVNARIRHTKNCEAKLDNLPAIIDAAVGVQAEFAAAMESFAEMPVSEKRAERIFTGFLTDDFSGTPKRKEVISTRATNTVSRLVDLFKGGPGNRGQNGADLFSAVTDYYSHESSGREAFKQFESSEFGSGLTRKTDFFESLSDAEVLETVEDRGARALALVN